MKTSLQLKLKEWERLRIIIRSKHQFKKIKNWKDYLIALGYSLGHIEYAYEQTQLQRNITWEEIRKNLEAIKENLETSAKEELTKLKEERTFVIAGSDSNRDRKLLSFEFQTNSITQLPIAHEYPIGNFYEPVSVARISFNDDKISQVQNEVSSGSFKEHILNIELPPSEKEKANLFKFQKQATIELLEGLNTEQKRAMMLIAFAGAGKTFIIGAYIRRILDFGWLTNKTFSPWPIIYVTKAPILTQTNRVLEEQFGIDTISEVLVINIEQLRAKFGQMFVIEKTIIERGEEIIKFLWRNNIYPAIILWDECQGLKNKKAIQSKIAASYNDIDTLNTRQIYFSATPFTTVEESRNFVVACKLHSKKASFSGESILVTNKNWDLFASNVAAPADPKEHSPAAVEKLMKELMPYVVDIKGVRPQFKAFNKIEIVEFETKEDSEFYHSAWDRWLKDKARFEAEAANTGRNMGMCILAAFTKFRQAAELCKAKLLARRANHKLKEGYAPVIGACFKTTIVRVVSILVNDYHIPRSKISLIWGGKSEGKSKALKKKTLREKLLKHKNFLDELAKMGSSIEELGLSTSDIAELMDEEAERLNKELGTVDLQLGSQSKIERQKEIDKFQSGISDICIFTGKAGGVGLSLHHCDDMFDKKVRRKPDSNYAVEEDIPLIPLKPRSLDATPVYSAIELVQIFGRCPRLTSLSDTQQSMLFFTGTIEEEVAASVSMKLKCLKKVVRQKEHWEDLILKTVSNYDYKKAKAMIPDEDSIYDDNNDGTELFGDDSGEDDEE